QATTHGITVYGGNRYATERRQRCERFTESLRHVIGASPVAVGEGFQVSTGGEELFPLASHHQREDVPVGVELFHGRLQRGEGIGRPGVGRRIGDGQYGNVSTFFQLNQFTHHKFLYSPWPVTGSLRQRRRPAAGGQ